MPRFYSQQGEDQLVYQKYINKPCIDGIYVELGALDGIRYSNTKFFEDELGFSGVLIEPIPGQFRRLELNRPNNKLYNVAVSTHQGSVEFIGDSATGGMSFTMAESFKARWHDDNLISYEVPSLPLANILQDAEIEYIDFFSLDVEGGELEVLKSMNWKLPIYLVVVEMDSHNKIKNDKCRMILENNGFQYQEKIGMNEVWLNQAYERIGMLFSKGS